MVWALALGIGATGAIFSVVSAQLVRALPLNDADRLVAVGTPEPEEPTRRWVMSLPDTVDLREALQGTALIAAWTNAGGSLTGIEFPERIETLAAEPQLMEVLQVVPQLGRTFVPEDGVLGAPGVAMLTSSGWRKRFGADPSIVGKAITLDGERFQVIGVLPETLRFPLHTAQPELWVPLSAQLDGPEAERNRKARWLQVTGRLAAGATLDQLRTKAQTVMARLAAEYPESNAGFGSVVEPLRDRFNAKTRKTLLLLLGAALVVLLLACANASNLLLARAAQRRSELAVRTALGASPGRLLRQFVAEAVVLGLAGGALGVALTWALVALMRGYLPAELQYLNDIRVDGWVVLLSAALAVATGLVVSLAPTWAALRVDPQAAIKASGEKGSTSRSAARVRDGLVVLQTACAALLMVAAGLLIRSAWQLSAVDPGFDGTGVFSTRVTLYASDDTTDDEVTRLNEALLQRLATAPGVLGVSSAFPSAFGSGIMRVRTGLPGATPAPMSFHTVAPGFFSVMKTPLLHGREFTAEDRRGGRQVVVINALLASSFWPEQDPLGRELVLHYEGSELRASVVGVVANVLHAQLDGEAAPQVYAPQAQWPMPVSSVVLRSTLPAHAAEQLVRSHLRELGPNLPIDRPDPLGAVVARSIQQRHFQTLLIVAFAVIAVLIAAHGVYAVTAYAVARRTREIGIRVALGAQRRDVVSLVLSRVALLAGLGTVIGLTASFYLGDSIQPLLFKVSPNDPWVLVSICAVVGGVALIAALSPSLRASRIDPTVSLRSE